MIEMMSCFGIEVLKSDSGLKVKEGKLKQLRPYKAPKDHRIIMVHFLFLKTIGGGELANEQEVKKSFASFFDQFEG